jgi:hypothetical protein
MSSRVTLSPGSGLRGRSPPYSQGRTPLASEDAENVDGLFDKATDALSNISLSKYVQQPVFGRVIFWQTDLDKILSTFSTNVREEIKRHQFWLMVMHIVCAVLLVLNGLAALFCGLFWVKKNRPLYVVTEEFNSGGGFWYASLSKAGNFRDPFMLAAASFVAAIFEAIHVFPFRNLYNGMVIEWTRSYGIEIYYNAFRWLWKGLFGGAFFFVAQHMLGVLDVAALSLGWVVILAYCVCMLTMEMFNPVTAIVLNEPPKTKPATAWMSFIAACGFALAWVAIATTFFAISLADAGIKNYPIYLIVLWCWVLLTILLEVIGNGLRHGQAIIRKYVWVEYANVILNVVQVIGITMIIIIGAGASKK